MGDDHDGLPLFPQPHQEAPQPLLLGVVLTDRGLVEDDDLGVPGQDGGEGHPLPLPPAEGEGARFLISTKPEEVKDPGRPLLYRISVEAEVPHGEGDLLLDALGEELVIGVLEDQSNPPREGGDGHIRYVPAINVDLPSIGPEKPVEVLHQRRLPSPILAHYRQELSLHNLQGYPLQGLDAVRVGEVEVPDLYYGTPPCRLGGLPSHDRLEGHIPCSAPR